MDRIKSSQVPLILCLGRLSKVGVSCLLVGHYVLRGLVISTVIGRGSWVWVQNLSV